MGPAAGRARGRGALAAPRLRLALFALLAGAVSACSPSFYDGRKCAAAAGPDGRGVAARGVDASVAFPPPTTP
jgi:hypothetical protein